MRAPSESGLTVPAATNYFPIATAPTLVPGLPSKTETSVETEDVNNSDQIEGWTYSDSVEDNGRIWTHAEDRFLWQIYRRYQDEELADIAKLVRQHFSQINVLMGLALDVFFR